MTRPYRIAVLVGSLRKASINRKVAVAMQSIAPPTLAMTLVEIGDLPHYDEDLEVEGSVSAAWSRFREAVRPADGVLFVTPEYNRGISGALKNAIDVGSRPYSTSVWSKKPGGVVTASSGTVGGFGANHALRQTMVSLDVPMLQQPEAYLGGAGKLFAADGSLVSDATLQFFAKFIGAYADWVAKIVGPR